MPSSEEGEFGLELVSTFGPHPEFLANTWVMSCTSNGRHLLAPTTAGKVFVWNIATREHIATLYAHEDMEVRDILFHPTKPYIFTSGDGMSFLSSPFFLFFFFFFFFLFFLLFYF
jgi:WD40 repeat protein